MTAALPTSDARLREMARARTHKPGAKPFAPLRIVAFVVLAVLALSWITPFVWALITSFKSEVEAAATPITFLPTTFNFDAYAAIFSRGDVVLWAGNSLLISSAVTAIVVATSALAAYALARLDFAGRRWLLGLIVAAIIVPPQVLIIPFFYEMLAFNLVDTFLGVILPQTVVPAMVFILKQFFDQVPIELEDAARVDGASRLRVFWSVVLPLSRPILAAVAIFVFIGAWNNFLWPFLITNDPALMTLPVGLQTVKNAYGLQYAQNMALAVVAAAPLIIVFLFFQRQIIRGIATTGFGGT